MTYVTDSKLDFDISTVSWVMPRLAVTNIVGAQIVWKNSRNCVINTAAELQTHCDYKIPVAPYNGEISVRDSLNTLAHLIHTVFEETQLNVVVHCYAGMERSALTCVWYMHQYHDMTLDEAYDIIKHIRPIVLDRREWIDV